MLRRGARVQSRRLSVDQTPVSHSEAKVRRTLLRAASGQHAVRVKPLVEAEDVENTSRQWGGIADDDAAVLSLRLHQDAKPASIHEGHFGEVEQNGPMHVVERPAQLRSGDDVKVAL